MGPPFFFFFTFGETTTQEPAPYVIFCRVEPVAAIARVEGGIALARVEPVAMPTERV